jgi:predicted component of type VI protein secretion system
MTMVLVPVQGGRAIPLDKAIVFFGRGSECDIVLNTSRKVSRKHCCIAQIDDRFVVRDLGSMNGVRINEQIVEQEAPLNVGDIVWVGDVGFRLQLARDARSPSAGKEFSAPGQKPPAIDPDLLSQDMPVAIPDESVSFRVEESRPQHTIPEDEMAELRDSDIVE